MEVVAVANQASILALRDFPNLVNQGSITSALVDTMAKACDQHSLVVLKGLEETHENWVKLKKAQSKAEIGLFVSNSYFFD